MSIVTGFCRYALPGIAFIILFKCMLTLLIGHPVNKIYGYIVNKATGEKIPLNTWETSVGRSKSCDIVLDNQTVSRFHAVICRRTDGWYIFDTVSKGGTFVNDEEVENGKTINHSDLLRFGTDEFYFAVVDDPVITVGKRKKNRSNQKNNPVMKFPNEGSGDNQPFSFDNMRLNFDVKSNADFSGFDSFNEDIYSGKRDTYYVPKAEKAKQKQASLKGSNDGFVYELFGNSVTVGRGRGMDIKLSATDVSRNHAVLTRSQNKWYITDTGSTCGTFVNGRKIEDMTLLHDGDEVKFSKARFVFTESC